MDVADKESGRKDLIITRTFDVPRELAWKAWTDPKLMAKWWGPRGVTNPTCKLNAKPGGEIYIVMLAGKELGNFAGQKWPMKGTFQELTRPERLVYTSAALDDKKGVMIETKNVLMLEKLGDKTKMTLHIVVTKVSPRGEFALSGMETGWNQSIDKLGELLEKAKQ